MSPVEKEEVFYFYFCNQSNTYNGFRWNAHFVLLYWMTVILLSIGFGTLSWWPAPWSLFLLFLDSFGHFPWKARWNQQHRSQDNTDVAKESPVKYIFHIKCVEHIFNSGNYQGSLATQIIKAFSMPSQVLTSVLSSSMGSFFTVAASGASDDGEAISWKEENKSNHFKK